VPTETDHRTRSELIGLRAEPVTLIVSRMWRASWIVSAKIFAVRTTAEEELRDCQAARSTGHARNAEQSR
jgi:hypothetical protein